MKVEIQGKHLWFLEYTVAEFNRLQKLLTWEDKYSKSKGKIISQTLLFGSSETGEYYTFSGLMDVIREDFKKFEIVADDRNFEIQNLTVTDDILDNVKLRDYQVMAVRKAVNLKMGIIEIPTGGGKCFAKGTPILMFDGTIKNVEDIVPGDLLMGDDSKPRKVKSLVRGTEEMFRVTPKKGEPYEVNRSHILSFKVTNSPKCNIGSMSLKGGELLDVPLEDYLDFKKTHKHVLKGYRVSVDFPEQSIDIDPYFLGLWLGDGRSDSLPINTPDWEIVQYLNGYAFSLGMELSKYYDPESKADNYAIVTKSKGGTPNLLLDMLRSYGLIQEREEGSHPQCHKYIPHNYLANNRETRLKVLAGLLDTDGYLHPNNYFDLVLVSKKLFDDATFLAQTLGFGTTVGTKIVKGVIYHRIHIYGDVHKIPTLVAHKQATVRLQKKDVLVTGVTAESIGIGNYYGFEIAGNSKRFLLGDCTVVHNTEVALGITRVLLDNNLIKKTLIVTPSVPIVKQFKDRALKRGFKRSEVGCLYGQEKDFHKPIVFAVVNSLAIGLKEGNQEIIDLVTGADLIVMDEVHHGRSDSFLRVAYMSESEYLIGMSGTPFKDRRKILDDIGDSIIYGLIGRIILKISQKTLVDKGYIADTVIFMKPVKGSFKKYKSRFNVIYKREIVDNDVRNKYIVEYCDIFVKSGLSVLVSVNVKAHALYLMQQLRKYSPHIRSICIFGGSEAQEYDPAGFVEKYKINQEAFFTDFENGNYDVIIATQVMDEGVDLPSVGALCFGGSGRSIRQIRQRLGRGTRSKKTGRNEVFILDFFDRGHIYMFHQSKKRLDIYLDEVESDVLDTELEFLDLIKSCSGN